MRITNKVMSKNFLYNLGNNLEQMQKVQNQLSTGHEVHRPSDDPFRVSRVMELTASISANARYKTNIEEALGWVNTVDIALSQANEILQTIREKTIDGGNGGYSLSEKKAIAKHIEQLKEQLVNVFNTDYDGRYIFGGDETINKPFEIDLSGKVSYKGSNRGLIKEISFGVNVDISTKGLDFDARGTGISGEVGLFDIITQIIDNLNNDGNPADLLGDFDKEFDKFLLIRAEVGAKQNRLETMLNKNELESFNMTKLLSYTYDIDIAKKVMEYNVMESVYTASLQTGAKILQPSLLDFIR